MSTTTTIVATINKDSKDQKCGISFDRKTADEEGPVLIGAITEGGLFAGSGLKPGMAVKTINDQSVATSQDAVDILKEAEGQIKLVATLTAPTPQAQAAAAPAAAASDSPPGVGSGGQWGTNKYVGSSTQAAACVGCLCCCLPGLCILLCPMDERDAYKHEGKVYDASGTVIGPATNTSFVPKRNAPAAAKMAR